MPGKNSDNVQFGLVSLTGETGAPANAGDGLPPLVDQFGRQYVVQPGSVQPLGAPAIVKLGPGASGFDGLSGRLLRVFGTVDAASFAQLFFGNAPAGDPNVVTQLLAAGNFEIDLSQNGGVQLAAGLGWGWSSSRDTWVSAGASGVAFALVVQ